MSPTSIPPTLPDPVPSAQNGANTILAGTAAKAIAGGGSVAVVSLVVLLHYQVMQDVGRIYGDLHKLTATMPLIKEEVSLIVQDLREFHDLVEQRHDIAVESRTEIRLKVEQIETNVANLQSFLFDNSTFTFNPERDNLPLGPINRGP